MCISMELVTAVLGDHGQRPQEDYGEWARKYSHCSLILGIGIAMNSILKIDFLNIFSA